MEAILPNDSGTEEYPNSSFPDIYFPAVKGYQTTGVKEMTKKTKNALLLLIAVVLTLTLSLAVGQVAALAGSASNQTGEYRLIIGEGAAW
jgi:hypothetical protein